jgi:hypothetical protein
MNTGLWVVNHFPSVSQWIILPDQTELINYGTTNINYCRSQYPRRSTAARLLRSWVRIPPGAWMFVCCVCCQLEVSATSWSLDCGASLFVIKKPREQGGYKPALGCRARENNNSNNNNNNKYYICLSIFFPTSHCKAQRTFPQQYYSIKRYWKILFLYSLQT